MNWLRKGNKSTKKTMNKPRNGQSKSKSKVGKGKGNQSPSRQQSSHHPQSSSSTRLFPLNSSSKSNSVAFKKINNPVANDNQSSYNYESIQQQTEPISTANYRRQKQASPSRPEQKKRRIKRRKKNIFQSLKPLYAPFMVVFRLIVIVIGVSSIMGTTLSIVNSNNHSITDNNSTNPETIETITSEVKQPLESFFNGVSLGEELSSLKLELTTLSAKYNQLQPGIFVVDLDNNSYVTLKEDDPFASASTIKVPVLVALFQDIDRGKVNLNETLVMSEDVIAGGSGNMQYEKPGKQYSVLETATKMIVISDNTATNMLIKRLGGAEALNQRFLEWGLGATIINNPLPDLEGTNKTSPADLGNLLIAIEQGKLVSLRSRDRIIQIMRETRTNTLLPEGLDKDASIAHKTGDIRSVLGDVGLVDMPSGKRYLISVLVKRPDNDPKAKELIQQISRIVYQHLR